MGLGLRRPAGFYVHTWTPSGLMAMKLRQLISLTAKEGGVDRKVGRGKSRSGVRERKKAIEREEDSLRLLVGHGEGLMIEDMIISKG